MVGMISPFNTELRLGSVSLKGDKVQNASVFTVSDKRGVKFLTLKAVSTISITLKGDNPMTIGAGGVFTEPGAVADGNVDVTSSGTVDTMVVGTYEITYTATDAQGNETTATRTVNVVDTQALAIALVGDNLMFIERDATFTDLGVTTEGVDVTVASSGTVDATVVGTYEITYTATDSNMNVATATRKVVVRDIPVEWSSTGDFRSGTIKPSSVSTSADGNRIVVGERGSSDGEKGQVIVFEWNVGEWVQIGDAIVGAVTGEEFGYTACISGDGSTVAIGATYTTVDFSVVRIYRWENDRWEQRGNDFIPFSSNDYVSDDPEFGRSLSLNDDGNIVAIGTPRHTEYEPAISEYIAPGKVEVWRWADGAWEQIGANIRGVASDARAGMSVSLNSAGDIVAVGCTGTNMSGSVNFQDGYVAVYAFNGTEWAQLGDSIPGNQGKAEHFGRSVSLSNDGMRLAIGIPFNDGNGPYAGFARVYELRGGWQQLGDDIQGSADSVCGWNVSLDGDGYTLAVGFRSGDTGRKGLVSVFQLDKNSADEYAWMPLIAADGSSISNIVPGDAANDAYELSTSMSENGNTIIVGLKGYARVFRLQY